MTNGKPVICEDICMGCSKCVNTCPKSLISIVPKDHKTLVACSNKQKGAPVVKMCGVSCIACSMCVKQCEEKAIEIVDNLAVINYELCNGCGKCKEVCKRKVLI